MFEHEPAVNPKLVRLARAGKVVLLPHMGSATIEGRIDMGEKVIVNIRTFMDGHRPPDQPGIAIDAVRRPFRRGWKDQESPGMSPIAGYPRFHS